MPYPVLTVNGRAPHSLSDFAGEASFTVDKNSAESIVTGAGAAHEDGVRFHEKATGHGKDVRVWQIRETAEDAYIAQSVPNF